MSRTTQYAFAWLWGTNKPKRKRNLAGINLRDKFVDPLLFYNNFDLLKVDAGVFNKVYDATVGSLPIGHGVQLYVHLNWKLRKQFTTKK